MVKNIIKILEQKDIILAELNRHATKMQTELFRESFMNDIMIIPDKVALKYLEFNYFFDTHFKPGGLPGVGMSTSDLVVEDGKKYILFHSGVSFHNLMALHLVREVEDLYLDWSKNEKKINTKIKTIINRLKKEYSQLSDLPPYKDVFLGSESYVGWDYLGTPSEKFVTALTLISKKIKKTAATTDLLKSIKKLKRQQLQLIY